LYYREEATTASSTFFLRQEKDDQKIILEDKDLEVIGAPIIKYGDSTVLVQHSDTGLWLTYKVCILKNLKLNYLRGQISSKICILQSIIIIYHLFYFF